MKPESTTSGLGGVSERDELNEGFVRSVEVGV
jgi:hypothetical protein